MKLPNFLIHTFAAVGVISLIFWSCAAADSDSIDNPPQLTGGTYQVELIDDDNTITRIAVLNTQTGVMKSYTIVNAVQNPIWMEDENVAGITFTH